MANEEITCIVQSLFAETVEHFVDMTAINTGVKSSKLIAFSSLSVDIKNHI